MVVEVLGWWVWYLKQYIMEVAMFSGRTDYSASCSIVYLRLLSKKNFIIISYHFKTFKLLFACRVIPKALMPYEVNFSFIAILSSLFGASPINFFLSHFLLFFFKIWCKASEFEHTLNVEIVMCISLKLCN